MLVEQREDQEGLVSEQLAGKGGQKSGDRESSWRICYLMGKDEVVPEGNHRVKESPRKRGQDAVGSGE